MLENPSSDPSPVAATTVKRYAPPNQRNRSLSRRKSGGGGLERASSYSNDGERNTVGANRTSPLADHVDNRSESLRVKLIPLNGCSNSDAFQLINNRWANTINTYNSLPEDSAERPVLYTKKSASAWGQPILPHLLMQSGGSASAGVQRDFLSDLRQAMQNTGSGPNT